MAICLVTGGAGFIGSHLVEARCWRGATARVLDDFSTGSWDNLEEVRERVEVIEGDITDPATVRSAMRDVEVVFHEGRWRRCPSVANPLATHRVCVDGTLQVLLAARDAKVRRVVYAASSAPTATRFGCPKARAIRRPRCRRMPCRSWPANTTAPPSARSTVWKRCDCVTSTSSARGRRRTVPMRR